MFRPLFSWAIIRS